MRHLTLFTAIVFVLFSSLGCSTEHRHSIRFDGVSARDAVNAIDRGATMEMLDQHYSVDVGVSDLAPLAFIDAGTPVGTSDTVLMAADDANGRGTACVVSMRCRKRGISHTPFTEIQRIIEEGTGTKGVQVDYPGDEALAEVTQAMTIWQSLPRSPDPEKRGAVMLPGWRVRPIN